MRQPALLALAAACVLALVALPGAFARSAADPGITSSTILIGGTSPLTGPAAAYASVARGAKAYFDSVNAKGGVNKRKITYKILDDAYNPAQSIQVTRQLVEQDKVFAVFNSLGTEQNLAVREYLNQVKVPQLFVASGATTLGKDAARYPWTIGFQPSYQAEGWVYGQYVARSMKRAKIAVLFQNDDYGKDLLAGLKRGLGRSGSSVVAAQPYEVTATDVSSQIARLKASGANVLAIFATPRFAIQAYVYANRLGWRPRIINNTVSAASNIMLLASEGGKNKSVAGHDLAQLPQGPERPEVAERPGDEELPRDHGAVRQGREPGRPVTTCTAWRWRTRRSRSSSASARTRRARGYGEGALDLDRGQPVPPSGDRGEDRPRRRLPGAAGPAPALDEGEVGALRRALGVEAAVAQPAEIRPPALRALAAMAVIALGAGAMALVGSDPRSRLEARDLDRGLALSSSVPDRARRELAAVGGPTAGSRVLGAAFARRPRACTC